MPTDKAKEKLIALCSAKITRVFDGALSFIEVLLDESQYKKIRSKILRIGNNAIREMESEIMEHYSITYDSKMTDIIKVGGGNNAKEAGDKKTV